VLILELSSQAEDEARCLMARQPFGRERAYAHRERNRRAWGDFRDREPDARATGRAHASFV